MVKVLSTFHSFSPVFNKGSRNQKVSFKCIGTTVDLCCLKISVGLNYHIPKYIIYMCRYIYLCAVASQSLK